MNGDVDDKAALSKYRAVQSFRSLRFGGHITLVVRHCKDTPHIFTCD